MAGDVATRIGLLREIPVWSYCTRCRGHRQRCHRDACAEAGGRRPVYQKDVIALCLAMSMTLPNEYV